jgi:hypothetical protein
MDMDFSEKYLVQFEEKIPIVKVKRKFRLKKIFLGSWEVRSPPSKVKLSVPNGLLT